MSENTKVKFKLALELKLFHFIDIFVLDYSPTINRLIHYHGIGVVN